MPDSQLHSTDGRQDRLHACQHDRSCPPNNHFSEMDVAAMKATHQPTLTPASDPMRPSALLRGAALYLFLHGWRKGGFFDFASGKPFPRACALGAINASAYGCAILGSDNDADDANTDAAIKAMRVFAAHIDPEYDANVTSAIDVIGDWNDDQSRTVGEVIETLTEAADDWDRAHTTGGAR